MAISKLSSKELEKMHSFISKCCLRCKKCSDECLVHFALSGIKQASETGDVISHDPSLADLPKDLKKYDYIGLDLALQAIENMCQKCETHERDCIINKARKCLQLLLYGKILPFRDETMFDEIQMRGKSYVPSEAIRAAADQKPKKDFAGEDKKEILIDSSPAVKTVEYVLNEALQMNVSDIHIEPKEDRVRCRYRIDGFLKEQAPIPIDIMLNVISRIKLMSGMNIAQNRLPQDGRFSILSNEKTIDFRVSAFPSVMGEKIVIRILEKTPKVSSLDGIGFMEKDLNIVRKTIKASYGMFMITGPTGSGKSSTLYAALKEIASSEKNIVTLEDPVEAILPNITQGQINPKIDFTFASGLKSILRQDPDVIMVGEIRDKETAEMSIRASITGHLVFSTLHTNTACGAFMRLIDMGVESFMVATSVKLVMAQRLVRTLCQTCKKKYNLDEKILKELGFSPKDKNNLYEAGGCKECSGVGYKGRVGIFEVMPIDEEIRALVIKGASADEIQKKAIEKGMTTMRMDGLEKVKSGITSMEEVLRVIGEE